jgi:hypothetical protein
MAIFLIVVDKIQYKATHERSILEGIFAIILTNVCKAKEMIVFTIENC